MRLAPATPLMAPAAGCQRVLLIISASASIPAARQKRSKLADMPASAWAFNSFVGIAVDVLWSIMALLPFVESAPRA
jgi:hypothetical protein